MSETAAAIDEFTDPLCPWAWSAEPFRLRLEWLYGDTISLTPRMVILADERADQEQKGFTPEKLQSALRQIAADHKMPIDTALRKAVPASLPACKAVVAVRVNGEHLSARRLLRELRVANFKGELIDRDEVIDAAAEAVGIDPTDLSEWATREQTVTALEADRADARDPSDAALVLNERLADAGDGRRYTCPSYEITRTSDGLTMTAPGFQPERVYTAILANLLPQIEHRPAPASVSEVLEWADYPLATKEVAAVCGIDFQRTREELGRVASIEPIGTDGLWSLN